jgi:hypothetical protein
MGSVPEVGESGGRTAAFGEKVWSDHPAARITLPQGAFFVGTFIAAKWLAAS